MISKHTKRCSTYLSQNGLIVGAKTKKFLEENLGVNLCDLRFGNGFFGYNTIKHKQQKKNKLDLINIKKNFCALKDTTKKVERQPMEREKIFANHISDKELVFKIF